MRYAIECSKLYTLHIHARDDVIIYVYTSAPTRTENETRVSLLA